MLDRQSQQPQNGTGHWTPVQDARNAAALLMLAAQTLSAPLEVFLRVRFGRCYFGVPSALALLAVPMWMALWPGEDPRPILVFWGLFILMQLRARIESIGMVSRGEIVHTRYDGRPRLASLLRRTPEISIKNNVEPWAAMLAGIALMPVSEPLGSYVLTAGFCLGLCGSAAESAQRRRAMQLHDAWIEQQALAQRFRDMQHHRR